MIRLECVGTYVTDRQSMALRACLADDSDDPGCGRFRQLRGSAPF
jgi:hypothetical protein